MASFYDSRRAQVEGGPGSNPLVRPLGVPVPLDGAHRSLAWHSVLQASRLSRRACAPCRNALTRRADVVFTTSRSQANRRRTINPRTHLIPNAVDFELFSRAVTDELPVPADLADVPRPILGYVGWLTDHIDVALLRRVVERYAHCSLVLVGPGQLPGSPDLDALRTRANVVFVGRRDQAALPAYLRVFDVAPVFGGSGVRIKVLDAFRAGLPIVTTPDGALGLPLTDGKEILIASDPDAFAERVERLGRDESLRARLRDEGYAYLETHHSRAAAQGALREALGLGASRSSG